MQLKMNLNLVMLFTLQLAILVGFNSITEVNIWINIALLIPTLVFGIHILMTKIYGKGLPFLEISKISSNMNSMNRNTNAGVNNSMNRNMNAGVNRKNMNNTNMVNDSMAINDTIM